MLDREKIELLLREKQYGQVRSILEEENSADISALLEDMSEEDMLLTYRFLSKDIAAEVFSYMEPEQQEDLIRVLSDQELSQVVRELYLDDAVDLVDEMPSNLVSRILQVTSPQQRRLINEFLKYPSDSAGALMTIEFVSLRQDMTVRDAFDRIRQVGVDKETIYTCYVLDPFRVLVGVITVKELLLAKADDKIQDLMETNVFTVSTLSDRSEVAAAFEKYDFLALPVVDKENRLVGIITIDDALDVIQDENTEDIQMMAAISPSDKEYLRTGVFDLAKQRIIWLLLLMISATVTGRIILHFEKALDAATVLTSFIPMLMDTGGNCGSQASVTVIRGLALGEIEFRDLFRVLWKEFRVALMIGLVLSVINFGRILLFQRVGVPVALCVSISLFCTVVVAKLIGCFLPIIAKKIGFDPAVMASPFITTLVDALSLIVFFNIATGILGI